MGKLFVLMGKSASGKDTIFSALKNKEELALRTVVGYTTRPRRNGEQDGREYFFVSEERWQELCTAGKVIETRTYHTVKGDWHYFTADDGQITKEGPDILFISTLAGYQKLRDYFGPEHVVPLYIEVEDGLRLQRALERERRQKTPNYEELCRRFLADSRDFSEDNLREAGVEKRYLNFNMEECVEEIVSKIKVLFA